LDLVTFVGVPLALALVVLLACRVPARRTTRVDPVVACGKSDTRSRERCTPTWSLQSERRGPQGDDYVRAAVLMKYCHAHRLALFLAELHVLDHCEVEVVCRPDPAALARCSIEPMPPVPQLNQVTSAR